MNMLEARRLTEETIEGYKKATIEYWEENGKVILEEIDDLILKAINERKFHVDVDVLTGNFRFKNIIAKYYEEKGFTCEERTFSLKISWDEQDH